MKKLVLLVCFAFITASCKENFNKKTSLEEQINFEKITLSQEDSNILNEGFKRDWEIIKDEHLSILVNRDIIYYIYKNPTEDQLKHRFYLHLVIKETREFINLDFNFNEHEIGIKSNNESYKIAKRELPLKDILSITTGQVIDGKSIWELYIDDKIIY